MSDQQPTTRFATNQTSPSLSNQLASSIAKGRTFGKRKRTTRQLGSYLSSASKKRTVRGMSTANINSIRTQR